MNMSHIPERILVQAHLAAKQPQPLSPEEEAAYRREIAAELKKQNAVLVAHYYTDPVLQALAEETGGCVSDSLEMARFGSQHPAKTLVVAGVRFMGETAKILNPGKTRADADAGSDLLARHRLPGRRILRVLRSAPRPHRGGLCQHLGGREGARRLGGDLQHRAADRRKPDGQRRKNSVGARPVSGPLHAARNRRRHAAVGWRVHRARGVQGQATARI